MRFRHLHCLGIEIDPAIVKMGEFDGIEEIDVSVQIGPKGVRRGEEGMGSNNQASFFLAAFDVRTGPDLVGGFLGVDDQDMTPLDGCFHAGDQEDPALTGVGSQVL